MALGEVAAEPTLRDYARVLARRKPVVGACTLAATAIVLVWSLLQPREYVGRAEVLLLQPGRGESVFDPETRVTHDPVRAMQTEIRIVNSEPVRAAARARAGAAPRVSVKPVGQTDLIRITATARRPRRAADVANAYATAYIDFRRTHAVNDVLAAADQLRARIGDLQGQIDELDRRVVQAPAPNQTGIRDGLRPQKDSLLAQQTRLRERLDQLQVDAALESGGAQLVTRAVPASSPISPRPVHNTAVAGAFGLLIGVGLALLLDHFDDSLKSKEDIERVTPGLPVIALIPTVTSGSWVAGPERPGQSGGRGPWLVSLEDPQSAGSEAYRTLRTSIRFMSLGREVRSLQVTSAGAGEGKTTIVANLAVTLAAAGSRVVVVGADLRRPRVHEFFGIENAIGLTSVLLGTASVSSALRPVDRVSGLSVLPAGPVPPNPAELLSLPRVGEVLTSLQTNADVLLVDSPPVLPVSDALILATQVDGTVIVSVPSLTNGKQLMRTVELLRHVDAPLIGTVVNGVEGGGSYRYDYRASGPGTGDYRNSTLSPGETRRRVSRM